MKPTLKDKRIVHVLLQQGASMNRCFQSVVGLHDQNTSSITPGEGGLYVRCKCRASTGHDKFVWFLPWTSVGSMVVEELEPEAK